jgi:hypothetical protein
MVRPRHVPSGAGPRRLDRGAPTESVGVGDGPSFAWATGYGGQAGFEIGNGFVDVINIGHRQDRTRSRRRRCSSPASRVSPYESGVEPPHSIPALRSVKRRFLDAKPTCLIVSRECRRNRWQRMFASVLSVRFHDETVATLSRGAFLCCLSRREADQHYKARIVGGHPGVQQL